MQRPAPSTVITALSGRLIGAVARVRPDERRDAVAALLTLAGFMAGHALLETARDALFLATIPASQLPWVYLAIALVALGLTQRQPRLLRHVPTRHELSGWLVLSALVTFTFWVAIPWTGRWIYYALYTWSGVLATLVVVRFWTSLGRVFTVTQAKRVFALIGSGSVLGAIVGSALARALTEALDARHVVAAAALVFLASAAAPRLFAAGAAPPPTSVPGDLGRIAQLVWARPFLRRVAVLILFATVTFTLVDFVFKLTVSRQIPADDLGQFFSGVYLVLNVASLGIQVVAVAWLFRRVGVSGALAVVPALLLAASAGLVALGSVLLALMLKGIDGSLRHSLYRTGTELLFVPIPLDLRTRVKGVIDVVGQRGGQALASVAILIASAFTASPTVFAVATGVSAAVWLYLAVDLRPHYLNVFRETLQREGQATHVEFPALDVASLETLLTTLNSPDDRRVVAALDLLAAQRKIAVIPALILYHPSAQVVERALDLFVQARRDEVVPMVVRLSGHAHDGVRAAAIRARSVLAPDVAALQAALEDPVPSVAATALVGLVAGGWLEGEDAARRLNTIVTSGEPATCIALARAVRFHPAARFEETLLALAASEDPEVVRETIRAMEAVGSRRFVAPLVGRLPDREHRDQAIAALVTLGPTVLPHLGVALGDPGLPHAVRRHVPQAAAAFGTPPAADLLLQHLLRETDGMIRFKVLRALGRMRAEQPELPLDEHALRQVASQALKRAFGFMRWRRAIERGVGDDPSRRTPGHELLVALLRDKQLHTVERLFRLLNLQAHNDDFLRIYRGLQSPHRETRASSRELLENLVLPGLRTPITELLDDLYEREHARPDAAEDSETYEGALRALLDATESLSCASAYHIGELGLHGLASAIDRITPLSASHREVLERARARTLARAAS